MCHKSGENQENFDTGEKLQEANENCELGKVGGFDLSTLALRFSTKPRCTKYSLTEPVVRSVLFM